MKRKYQAPEAEQILFRALERLATEMGDPEVGGEVDLGGGDVTASGGVDQEWNWP